MWADDRRRHTRRSRGRRPVRKMTGPELREAFTRCGIRTIDAARLFEVSRAAVEHWLNARNVVPIRVQMIMTTLEELSPKDRLAWYEKNMGIAVDRKRGPPPKNKIGVRPKRASKDTGVDNGRDQETERL